MWRDDEKPLEWIGSSHKNLMALPLAVQRHFGYALSLAQCGDQHDAAKMAEARAKELRNENTDR